MKKEMYYVYEIYREKSFSKAAEKLFISQPALSAIVKKLENEIGLPLFDRSAKPIRLTEAGKFYIQSARKIMDIESDMEAYFHDLSNLQTGTVRLGAATYFCTYILPPVIHSFSASYPGLKVQLTEGSSPEILELLKDSSLDFSLDNLTCEEPGFLCRTYASESIILAVPSCLKSSELLAEKSLSHTDIRNGRHLSEDCPCVSLKAFENESFILLRRGNDMYQRASGMFERAGISPTVSMYLDQMMTAYHCAASQMGITFIRDSILHYVPETDRLVFFKLLDPSAKRGIYLTYRNNRYLPRAASAFLKFLIPSEQS
ncbi:LysR family transcriptional regulator [Lacrimispora sp. NSJ-141]|uniref:LysR family transcriptional regulator n=1 Tax=Lientehia hominis TaxID=2897778 RepID=A0AAP2RGY5_9FIRM|nr:LysR family transcriptional regulator [Lientehia hominis]MCD2491209.1 LysR family transcriptional regulator [Lientehia hominis]